MLRFLLLPLVVVQIFMMFGSSPSDVREDWDPNGSEATASPGWDPNGSPYSRDVRVGWDPDGSTAGTGSGDPDASPGWDPDGK